MKRVAGESGVSVRREWQARRTTLAASFKVAASVVAAMMPLIHVAVASADIGGALLAPHPMGYGVFWIWASMMKRT